MWVWSFLLASGSGCCTHLSAICSSALPVCTPSSHQPISLLHIYLQPVFARLLFPLCTHTFIDLIISFCVLQCFILSLYQPQPAYKLQIFMQSSPAIIPLTNAKQPSIFVQHHMQTLDHSPHHHPLIFFVLFWVPNNEAFGKLLPRWRYFQTLFKVLSSGQSKLNYWLETSDCAPLFPMCDV